jgi:CubicO group peptidase (beta-lactamase class C family)
MRTRAIGRIGGIAAVLALAVIGAHAQDRVSAPPDLDAYVGRVMQTFKVPGVSLAIVKDGNVVVAKGYGVRKLGEPAPVDAKTLFGIASNTKLFTGTALGLLVEEGRLEGDAPVIRYLPGFQMWDPYVTRELSVRDLLVHRSGLGLGAGDLLWWPSSTYDRKEIVRRLRHIRPATSFRSAYAYDNVLYLVAGEVIEAVSGQSWEDFVQSRILDKVGMTTSNVRHSDALKAGNVATPHAEVEGTVRPVAPFDSDNTNPAGGINSNADDMAKWMIVQLARGRLPDGSRLFSEATWRELTTLVTPMPIGNPPAGMEAQRPDFRGYALGIGVQDYRGRKVLLHTGGLPGYVSRVLMIPGIGLGISVLTNQESGAAFDSIAFHIADHYLGVSDTDWLPAYQKYAAAQVASAADEERRAAAARDTNSRPSLALPKYAGTYSDDWYGDVVIEEQDGKLVIRFTRTPLLVGDLGHWQYDTFLVKWRERELRADAYVTFSLNPDGSIDQVRMMPASPLVDFSYDFQDLLLKPKKTETPRR